MDNAILLFECKMHWVKQLKLFSQHEIKQEAFSYFHSFITIIWSYGSKKIPIVMLHNEKMNDALGNHKYVIYMKKGAFAQPENTPK